MNPRRVTFTMSVPSTLTEDVPSTLTEDVPSTLTEDDEALQFFASAMWEEMLRRAGGIPAEALQFFASAMWEEMLRRAGGIPAEAPMVRAYVTDDQFANSELIHMVRMHIIVYAQPQIPVFYSDSLISGLVDAELTLTVTFDSGWTAPESVSFSGRMYEDQISTTPQPEHWVDAMHYSPDDGGDVIL